MAKKDIKVSENKIREEGDNVLDDSNIYNLDARLALVEEDEISLNEAAFMEGYEKADLHIEEE
jgi:hypothetical protein